MKQFIEDTFAEQVRDLQALVRIPSVSRGTPEAGKPLGREVDRALKAALELARKLGFTKVMDLDGYCGVVEYGEGKELLGVMAHLDVVPEGSGWTYPPYEARIVDGRMYGRGVLDDKGAAVSALYALAAVKNSGKKMRRRVRIILGCDEERGWACMNRYGKTEPEPDLAFTPDADYPVVNSEMGILQTVWQQKGKFALRIEVGTAPNVIPGEASAALPFAPLPVEAGEGYSVRIEGNMLHVTGRGGHAAEPQLAHNALLELLRLLTKQPLPEADKALVTSLHALLGMDRHGETLGVDKTDESGRLTLSPDMLTVNEEGATLTCDCRYPFGWQSEALLDTLKASFGGAGFTHTGGKNSPGHFIPAESELVRTLMDIYKRNTGSDAKPLSIGGGTYARSFHNAVAFGTVGEGEPSLCHMPDENVTLDSIKFNTLVMAQAIDELAAE